MFRYRLSMGRVHDLIEVREGTESLVLRVDADPVDIVRVITRLEPKMSSIQTNEDAKAEAKEICKEFGSVIFGAKQTVRLFDFYNDNSFAVLSMISKYLSERLVDKVTKAQKRARV